MGVQEGVSRHAQRFTLKDQPPQSDPAITKQDALEAWTFASKYQNRSDQDAEHRPTTHMSIHRVFHALRTMDPNISLKEVEWVLGKTDSTDPKSGEISFDDMYDMVKDLKDDEGLDAVEHAFQLFSRDDYLDLEKIKNIYDESGAEGVTVPILSMTIQRIRKKMGERGRKVASSDVDLDVFRRLLQGMDQAAHAVPPSGRSSFDAKPVASHAEDAAEQVNI